MKTALFISLGAAGGAMARYLVSLLLPFNSCQFAWGTFAVNMLGCMLIGISWASIEQNWIRQLLVIGFLGSFTTFSGFGLELLNYLEHAHYKLAIMYAILSIAVGIIFVYLGAKAVVN